MITWKRCAETMGHDPQKERCHSSNQTRTHVIRGLVRLLAADKDGNGKLQIDELANFLH